MNRVYCLYRVSCKTNNREASIPMQEKACRSFAQERGWEIIQEFYENGVSGYKKTLDERDALKKIREDAILGKFDILLVFMFDRIGRRDDETPFVVEFLIHNGIAVWSTREGEQRMDDHTDKLTNYIRFWHAAGESKKMSERVKTRIHQLAEEGQYTGGFYPFGYELVHNGRVSRKNYPLYDLQIKDDEAAVVREIFHLAAAKGYGADRITQHLNERGILTKKGRPWNPMSIRHILCNRAYIGIVKRGEAESPPQEHLRIIDDQTFQTVQELRLSRQNDRKATEKNYPQTTKGNYLLSGFLFCGDCGSRINGTNCTRKRQKKNGEIVETHIPTYRCNHKVDGFPCSCSGQSTYRARKLEELFTTALDVVLDRLQSIPASELAEIKYQNYEDTLLEQRQLLKDRLIQIKQENNVVTKGIVDVLSGNCIPFPQEVLQRSAQELQQKMVELECSLHDTNVELDDTKQRKKELAFHCEKYAAYVEQYRSAEIEEKKMLLAQLVKRVVVTRGYQLRIELNPDFESLVNVFDLPHSSILDDYWQGQAL